MIKGTLNNKEESTSKTTIKQTQNIEQIDDKKIFHPFLAKDIVFLAIVATVLIITCGVMPLVAELTKVLFGIAQVVTAFQLSLFTTIGVMKIRKIFSLTFILMFMAIIMFAMSPVMGVSNILVGLTVELLIILIFRNYRTNLSCFVAGALVAPLSLITPVVWNLITAPDLAIKTLENPLIVIGMTLAVIALGLAGSGIGVIISKELQKAGLLRKGKQK